jgi:MOSC domain-containing protein YiiM
MATVTSVNASPTGGVPKPPVDQAAIHTNGVTGDRQNHTKFHGGPMRAVCLYSQDHIDALRDEGHPISPGTIGENVTIAGLDWDALLPGVRLAIGDEVELEVTTYAVPCHQIAESFIRADSSRVSQKLYPGWARVYTKVLREGTVRTGDDVRILHTASV